MSSTSTTTSDLRLEVPLGSRVLVRSGIELTAPSTEDSRRSAKALIEELDRWQGTGALVLGGPLLAAGTSAEAALEAHLELREAIRRFAEAPGRSVTLLEVGDGETTELLTGLGIVCSESLLLACQTAAGLREVLVTPATSADAEFELDGGSWLEGSDQLENPRRARRFATSRALYRRLSHLLWIPPLLAVLVAYLTHLAFFSGRLARLGRGDDRHPFRALATVSWHGRVLWVLVVVVFVELLVAGLAVLLARRSFARTDLPTDASRRGEVREVTEQGSGPLDQRSMDVAREQLALGRSGAIIAGGPTPALTQLSEGFLAVCAGKRHGGA